MKGRLEIKFGGFGGQGIATMGAIVGEALTIYENKYALLRVEYGPESRGGASSADLIVSDQEIDYPATTEPDYLVLMCEEAYIKYIKKLKEGGTLIIEEDLVKLDDEAKRAKHIYKFPATRIAESLGNRIYANIAMLGFICATTGLVSKEALINAIKKRIKAQYLEKNLQAFEKGMSYKEEK